MPQFQTFVDAVLKYGYRPWHPNLGNHYRTVGAAMGKTFANPNASVKDSLDEAARLVTLNMEKFTSEYKG